MPLNRPASLRNALVNSADITSRLFGSKESVAIDDLARHTVTGRRAGQVRGQSVLIVTSDQLATALALIELDGIAGRIVIWPPDVPLSYLPSVMSTASVDIVLSDQTLPRIDAKIFECSIERTAGTASLDFDGQEPRQTEWVLLTSGTTGAPKMVVHDLASLTGAIQFGARGAESVVWSTFYDIRRYGGLQIFLRAVLCGRSLVLGGVGESTSDFLMRAGSQGVTHISGTPSHWRRALMSSQAAVMNPRYVRLSGEIADQGILNQLRFTYPQAEIVHAFASTEAGVAFEVTDGTAGFPANVIAGTPGVDMKVENRSLRIRSCRAGSRYLGDLTLKDADGFVDSRDLVERRGDRYYFVGREDGIINVGGSKVHPEEVEAVINCHPDVHISLVRTKQNPITGALVVADVVLRTPPIPAHRDVSELSRNIIRFCRETLPPHKIPAAINFVPALAVSETGKIARRNA
jgi:acyl-coenzyme A synthetase/AMP-(fatty) acid ligase